MRESTEWGDRDNHDCFPFFVFSFSNFSLGVTKYEGREHINTATYRTFIIQ